ncbi:MAG: hypothetical protein FJX74_18905 [Armatimonadetes bacterium]|nr:hypothetical protein [Armatimonadota bacterium]
MKQSVSPAMVIVALVILAIVVAGIWWFTMGKTAKKGGETKDAGTMQPKTPEEAAAAGYRPQGAGGSPATGQPAAGGPPGGMKGGK